jgi:hypothetical protein
MLEDLNLALTQFAENGAPAESGSEQPLLPGLDEFVRPVEHVEHVEHVEPQPQGADAADGLARESGAAEPPASAGWKAALRRNFEAWLGTLDDIPELETEPESEIPDLSSFYEQLAVANAETRKSNRRTVEAFSQWAETLERFEAQLVPLRESITQLTAAQPREEGLPRAYCLVLVEFLDRLHRLAKAFASPPARKSWWGGSDSAWRQAWETQRQGLDILVSHFAELLKKEEITRIETLGQPFNPTEMTAVAAEPNSERPAQTVLEELTPGYRRRGELLRPAQVKVSVRPP